MSSHKVIKNAEFFQIIFFLKKESLSPLELMNMLDPRKGILVAIWGDEKR